MQEVVSHARAAAVGEPGAMTACRRGSIDRARARQLAVPSPPFGIGGQEATPL